MTTPRKSTTAAKAPRTRKVLENVGGATVLTIVPDAEQAAIVAAEAKMGETPAKAAPKAAKAPKATKATPAYTDAALAELRLRIKKVRDHRWLMAKNNNTVKMAEDDAKLAELRAELDAAAGRSGGPSWVVGVDAATGKATTTSADDNASARSTADALRAKGLVVTIVAKAAK